MGAGYDHNGKAQIITPRDGKAWCDKVKEPQFLDEHNARYKKVKESRFVRSMSDEEFKKRMGF
tara:strand:+ start:1154 stop:1342 length:189 start_codon:yes stop_codon:yes gene_type:complete